jgi:hypothetical protein
MIDKTEWEMVKRIAGFMTYCFYTQKNQLSTIVNKLSGINHIHQSETGISLPVTHEWLKGIKEGMVRKQGDKSQTEREKNIRRPVTCKMLQEGEAVVEQWGSMGGARLRYLAMELAVTFLLRASEYLAYDNGSTHKQYCLSRGAVSFWLGEEEVTYEHRRDSDRVSVYFKASKGDRRREGATVSRSKVVGKRTGYDVVMDILDAQDQWGYERMSDEQIAILPLCAYKEDRNSTIWLVVKRGEQTASLRELIGHVSEQREARGKCGLIPRQFALHSFRIGGATILGSLGATDREIMEAGRWKSNSFIRYVRTSILESIRVSEWLGWAA